MREADRQFLTLRDAERIGPYSAKQIYKKIQNGTLIEGVHFTRPRRSHYVLIRDGFLAFLQGIDGPLVRAARPRGKINWDLVEHA
jgi:hypothetical protein